MTAVLVDLPVVRVVGHGNPDHCSVHGDIPRDVSIVAHINAEHGISYETHRALEKARDAILALYTVPVDAERLDAAMAATGIHVDLRRGDAPRPIGCNSCKPAITAILAALELSKP